MSENLHRIHVREDDWLAIRVMAAQTGMSAQHIAGVLLSHVPVDEERHVALAARDVEQLRGEAPRSTAARAKLDPNKLAELEAVRKRTGLGWAALLHAALMNQREDGEAQ